MTNVAGADSDPLSASPTVSHGAAVMLGTGDDPFALAGSLAPVERDLLQSFEDYLAQRADRPFGDVEAISGRTLQRFSVASQQAAENLLSKARRALDDADTNRANRLVDRAVQLPFDEHEGAAPAALWRR